MIAALLRGALCACALAAAGAIAPPASVSIDDLTWTELRDLIDAGKTTVLVPVGGTEQSGPRWRWASQRRAGGCRKRLRAVRRCRGGAGVAYVPEGKSIPRHAHAISRNHHHARRDLRKGSRIRRPQLQAGRVSRYRLARRSRRISETRWSSRTSSTASGARGYARPRARGVLSGDPDLICPGPQEPRFLR